MIDAGVVRALARKYKSLRCELDERARRLWAASEALALGHGGVAAVSRATGLAESTIRIGRRELKQPRQDAADRGPRRVRRRGGGRKRLTESDSTLLAVQESGIDRRSHGGVAEKHVVRPDGPALDFPLAQHADS